MILYLIRHGQSVNNLLADQIRSVNNDFDRSAYENYMANRVADPPLTEAGEEQADRLAVYLRQSRPKHRSGMDDGSGEPNANPSGNALGISRLYASPMLRALQTAQPVARALGLPTRIWIGLHEHGGMFENDNENGEAVGHPGLNRRQIEERFPNFELVDEVTDDGWWFAGEEDRAGCHARAVRVAAELHEMAGELEGERIAAVTHGTFLDSLIKAVIGRLPGDEFHIGHHNTAITRIDYTRELQNGSGITVVRYTNRVDHLTPELIT